MRHNLSHLCLKVFLMSKKNQILSELTEEEYQETLREISERLGIKMLPEDHPIYQEPPTIVLNPFPKNDSKEEEDDEQNSK